MEIYRNGWAKNDLVRIHFLEKGHPEPDRPSFIVSAGIWEPAERAVPLFNRLEWHHCVSFSYRGRGQSDTPDAGYDLEDHLGDLESVVRQTGIQKTVILGFSRGVACTLQFVLNHPQQAAGLIIVDYPPRQFQWDEGTAEFWKNYIYLGKPLTDFIRPHAIDCLEREAREISYWDQLPNIHCQVLILRGLKQDHPIPPNLTQEDADRYLRLFPNTREIGFEHSGHMLPDDEPEKYCQVIQEFLSDIR